MRTYKRLNLEDKEMKELQYIVKRFIESGERVSSSLQEKLAKPTEININKNKVLATSNATDAKIKKVIKKIKLSLEYIKRNELKMTYSAIARYGEISPITVKKYVSIENGKAIENQNFYYLSL